MLNTNDILSCGEARDVLRLMLLALKKAGKSGLKNLAEMAGLHSPASMSMILAGQRRLSIDCADRLAQAFHLDSRGQRYFTLLARRDLCTRAIERLDMDETLFHLRTRRESHAMESSQYRFLSIWYYPVIYALSASGELKFDAAQIAKRLGRGVTDSMVRSGIGDLINLGLLKAENGFLSQTHGPLRTNDSVHHLAIRRYHHEMLRLAGESLELPTSERELNGLTVLIPTSKLAEVKQRIREFREELNESLGGSPEGEVYQLNIQFFPMTRRGEAVNKSAELKKNEG